jgi:hypothetical protein
VGWIEREEEFYCKHCGTCGYVDCCGVEDFLNAHVKGKTNCLYEPLIISEIMELYQDRKDRIDEMTKNLPIKPKHAKKTNTRPKK